MDFELNEEHRLIQATVREFAAKEILPVAAELDHNPRYPAEIIASAAALGLLGLTVPEEYGGAGLDGLANVLVQEELARASAGVQAIVTVQNSLVCDPILRFGTAEQKRRYLPRLVGGEWLGCYCLTEPAAGSDAMSLRTRAERRNGEWVLTGQKIFVTNGLEAQLCIVYARTEPVPGARGISAFLVEKSFPGISVGKVEKKLGIKCSSTVEIVLADCRVPAENLLGARGRGGPVALATLDGGRIGIAAQALGIARAALEECVAYAPLREQFGQPIKESRRSSGRSPTWPRASTPRACSPTGRPGCATAGSAARRRRRWPNSSLRRLPCGRRTGRCSSSAATGTFRSTRWSASSATPRSPRSTRGRPRSSAW